MLYGHILEVEDKEKNTKKYILVLRDFFEFLDPDDREELTPLLRATFMEPGGDKGALYADVRRWAEYQQVSVGGIEVSARYFEPVPAARILQLERRILQMAALLHDRKESADQLLPALQNSMVAHTECDDQLEELKEVIECAVDNGCKHINEAYAEIHYGQGRGH